MSNLEILAPLLQTGSPITVVWLSGTTILAILLIFLLAKNHSQAINRSQRQAQQQATMVAFCHELLITTDLESELPRLLAEFLPALCDSHHLEIILWPEEILYSQGDTAAARQAWPILDQPGHDFHLLRSNPHPPASLAVPIRYSAETKLLGGIWFAPNDQLQKLEDWLPLLQTAANQIAAAFFRAEAEEEILAVQAKAYQSEVYKQALDAELALVRQQVAQELALAGRIQHSFLPQSVPQIHGWHMSVNLEPALETSGDYYDIISLPNGRLGLLVADVADKGIGSALYMALSRTLIRTYALEFPDRPAAALEAANRRILQDTSSDLFVTVFYATLDTTSGELTYCNAGHNPPLFFSAQEEPQELTRTAMPLGLFDDFEWEQASVSLPPGSLLLLYSDGITEAQNETGRFYGLERMQQLVLRNRHRSVEMLESKIMASIFSFCGDAPQFDDITLMLLAREPAAKKH